MFNEYLAEKCVTEYLNGNDGANAGRALINDVCEMMGLDLDENAYLLEDWLDDEFERLYRDTVIRCYDEEADDDMYQTRRSFYNGGQFLIKPTEYEVSEGILVPGHRFFPFCSERLFPEDMKLKTDAKGIRRKTVQMTMKESGVFYSLFGYEEFNEILCQDGENFDKLIDFDINDNPTLNFKVFNLKSFYKAHSFSVGDAIMATVTDFEKGKCELEYVPASFFMDKVGDIGRWCDAVESVICYEIENYEMAWQSNTFRQFESTLFKSRCINGVNLMDYPPIHIGGMLAQSKVLSLKPCKRRVLFWTDDQKHPEELAEEFGPTSFGTGLPEGLGMALPAGMEDMITPDMLDAVANGNLSIDDMNALAESMGFGDQKLDENSFDGLMHIMGFSLGEEEFAAYVRDELFSGGKSLDKVKERCFDERIPAYYSDLEPQLDGYCQNIWDSVVKTYNRFSDDEAGKIRHKVLQILHSHVKWMRSIEQYVDSPDDLPYNEVMELAEITNMMSQSVVVLNDDDGVTKQDVKTFTKMLGKLEPVVFAMMEQITDLLRSK